MGWPAYAGVISTSAATRSGSASANLTAVCAPIDTPANAARSISSPSMTARRSATRSWYSYAAGSPGASDSPWPRASYATVQ